MANVRRRGLLIVPETNTTMEREMNALCPVLAPFMVARVKFPVGGLTKDTLPVYRENTLAAIEPFLAERPALVVYGCTAAGFLGGRDGNAAMEQALRQRTGVPVVSTASAMEAVLRHERVRETAVVTPYQHATNDGLRAYLTDAGIAVEVLSSFLCENTAALCRVTEPEVRERALATVTPDSRALFIACSQLPTLTLLPMLRERFGIPVWSSIAATAWMAEQTMLVA
jgi:maleate isomerase